MKCEPCNDLIICVFIVLQKCEKLTLLIYSNILSAPFHEPVSPLVCLRLPFFQKTSEYCVSNFYFCPRLVIIIRSSRGPWTCLWSGAGWTNTARLTTAPWQSSCLTSCWCLRTVPSLTTWVRGLLTPSIVVWFIQHFLCDVKTPKKPHTHTNSPHYVEFV